MLTELRVENLLLIERCELRLAPGLNVITGETGAGKTMLAHALDLLLGGRAKPGIVRPGASEAYVEGAFELTDELRLLLGERLAADAEELVLARRVSAEGRTRAYLNGRTVAVAELRTAAERLLAFYGQHEHRRLTLSSAQLDALDAFCGPTQAALRERVAALHAEVRELDLRFTAARERSSERLREADLLAFELDEIDSAQIAADEYEQLIESRGRLRHIADLGDVAAVALQALDADEGGVLGTLAGPGAGLDALAGVDGLLDALAERWRAVALEAADVASELRSYLDGLEAQPGELEAVEERVAAIERLCRKHGGSVEAVLAHADSARARLAELESSEQSAETLAMRLASASDELRAACDELREARAAASGPFAARVRERLAELAMEGAEFEVELIAREPGPRGADTVEFLIAPNPGVAPMPLRQTASGGELSRVMLALMSVADDGGAPTLVFDEVDAGIGGHTARAVGARLRALGDERQIVCITHLPQVASLAQRHFSIDKDSSVQPARTTVRRLDEHETVDELARMLGAESSDGSRGTVRELLGVG